MTTLVLQDINKTVFANYTIDQSNPRTRFTIMDIRGLNDKEIRIGLPEKREKSSLDVFVNFAKSRGLKLIHLPATGGQVVLADFTNLYYNGGLGFDNI